MDLALNNSQGLICHEIKPKQANHFLDILIRKKLCFIVYFLNLPPTT